MVTNPHVWDTISSRTATFCSLCGVFVDPWQDAFVVHPELSWLNEIRVGECFSFFFFVCVWGLKFG